MIYVFTSAAVNYLPKVRILFNSIKRYHVNWRTSLVLVDKVPSWFKPEDYCVDKFITLDDLEIPDKNAWIFEHSIVELCTGVKAFALNSILHLKDCEAALYFDPDMVIFSNLDDLINSFEKASILLTPHVTKPEESMEAIIDNEICSLQHGIYNLGFIGVKNDKNGHEFVNWWQNRMENFCFANIGQGLFVDQRWIDLVPAFFDQVKIEKSPRFNVATWNITTRKVSGSVAERIWVDGEELGFYHFTGFDSGACQYMANKYAKDNPTVMNLIKWYEDVLDKEKVKEQVSWAYGYFDNKEPITDVQRSIYRMRKDLQKAFPNPFQTIETNFSYYRWFNTYAPKEHPELFDSPKRVPKSFRNYIQRAFRNRQERKHLMQKTWLIFRKEGFSGLKRALKS
jgi:hypothetical protein